MILLNTLAVLHDCYGIGQFFHNAEVMGNEQQSHVQLTLQFPQQLQDLRLDGNVQRGGGFIGNQQLRSR